MNLFLLFFFPLEGVIVCAHLGLSFDLGSVRFLFLVLFFGWVSFLTMPLGGHFVPLGDPSLVC